MHRDGVFFFLDRKIYTPPTAIFHRGTLKKLMLHLQGKMKLK